MSADLVAHLRTPFTLAALITTADEILAELLGGWPGPALTVHTGRRYTQGKRVADGRRLSASELESTIVNADLEALYEITVDDLEDGTWFSVVTFFDDPDDLDEPEERVEAICSPHRTCVGVVIATSVALAAAQCGNGEFIDIEIALLRPPVHDPRSAIAAMRLSDPGTDLLARCTAFIRQFEQLNGWPPDPSLSRPN
jgi:hypothetical protein